MKCLKIEIAESFRGKYKLRIGDLDGSVECYGLSLDKVLKKVKNEIEEAKAEDKEKD